MMRAGTAYGDGPDDHQLIEMLRIGELGNPWGVDVTPIEDLVQVHLGHSARGIAGIVITYRINDEAVKYPLHLDFNLVEEEFQLAGFNERGDVVIGIKTLARASQTFANLHRHGRTLVGNFLGWRGCFHKHRRYYQSSATSY